MFLVQLLLPVADNDGRSLRELHGDVRRELTDRFGGLTAYSRSPAEGLWDGGGERSKDDIVVYEVMAGELDAGWWREYRRGLEERFRQTEVVVRATEVRRL